MESYDAYEIDKYAIKVATHNFPNIKEHGDVFEADFTQYEGVDFLVGGSPCTYWSIAQTKNRETVASGMGWEMFSQYVRALKESNPKYFIYENNKSMSKQIRESIDDAFGFEAICINSALVSAQNRQRLYWVGKRNADGTYSRVNVEQPADRGILLKDVLDNAVAMREKAHAVIASAGRTTEREFFTKNQGNMAAEPVRGMGNDTKSRTLTANYWKTNVRDVFVDCAGGRTMVAEPVCLRYERTEEAKLCRKSYEAHEIKHGYNELNELHPRPDGKTNTLTTVPKDNQIMEPVCVVERGRTYRGQPQQYEARTDGKTNTLTSVEKDNRVAEPINVTADGKAQCLRATCYKDGIRNIIANEVDRRTGVAEPINATASGKAKTISASYAYKGDGEGSLKSELFPDNPIKQTSNYVAEPVQYEELSEEYYKGCADGNLVGMIENEGKYKNGKQPSQQYRVYSSEDKSVCVDTGQRKYYMIPYTIDFDDDGKPIKAIGKDGKEINVYEVKDGKITIKGKQYPIKLKDGYYIIRKLTVSECKRLQTVPEWYDFSVISNSQAFKCLGNGWTCEIICHLINSCFKPADALPGQMCLWG